MIGRESELRQVGSFLEAAGPGTRGLLLQGEAGIGKTTIWHAALDVAARHGYRVVVTRPTEAEARLPFAALNDLFGDLLDTIQPELPAPQQSALDVALMRTSVDGERMQPLALSLAVLELMRSASSKQPLAVAIDDVQWLDESSAGVVRFALRRLESDRVIVIVTERTHPTPEAPPILADLPAERLVRVPVVALGAEEIDRLLDESLKLRLSPTMLKQVQRLAGGNPFHAMEIGRALAARGVDQATGHVPLPESLGGLLRARLDSLPDAAHEVAVHVAGLSYPTAALIEATLGQERAQVGLAEARDADVLAPGDDPIRFTHPLLASEAMAALDDESRREMHRRLAGVVVEPEELARHLALGAPGPDPNVADALDAAATHAHGRGAPDAAAELSELAAGLTPADDPARARRMAAAGRYRLMAGDVGRAREILERALEEPAAASGPARGEVLFRLAGVRMLMDDFTASDQIGQEALHEAARDPSLTVQVKLLLAGTSYITGRNWSAGAGHAFEAMQLAEELKDPRLLAATIGPYASWRYATGHGHDRDLERRAAEVEQSTKQFRTLDLPEYDFAGIEFQEGDTASATSRMRGLLERAEADGDYSSLPFLLANLTISDFLEGRSDVAWIRIDRAARLALTTEQRVAQVHTLVCEARLAARLGDADRALSAGRQAFDLMATTSWRVAEWSMRAELALLQLSRGEASAAIGLLAGALDSDESDESGRRLWARGVAVEALVSLGRHEEAESAVAALEEHARSHGSPRLVADAARSRARLLAADGDLDGANAAIGEAESIHRRIDDPWELARTLLAAGDVHRRARRRARARTALREAHETFVFLGARLWVKQARDQLARIDATREKGGLTPTQRKVAELVASGLTNREAADRLFMSPHTVEAHLSAIYRALDIGSRGQLAAALAEGGATPRDSDRETRDSGRS